MPEVKDEELAAGLRAVKSRQMFFAVVAKSATDGHLIVKKTKISPAELAIAKKQAGGGQVYRGVCNYEDGKYVFETTKEPAGTLEQTIKALAKRDAGMTISLLARRGADDGEGEGNEGESEQPLSSQTVKPTVSSQPTTAKTSAPPVISNVKLQQARLLWDKARKKAQAEIGSLQLAILTKAKGESDFADIAKLVKDFEKLKQDFDESLLDKLDAALNAPPERRPPLHAEAVRMIESYQNTVQSNPLLADLDNNPFVKISVNQTLTQTLEMLAKQLKN